MLESVQPVEDHGRPFLFFEGRQTYEEALTFAGLADHDGPVFPIRVVGVRPTLPNPLPQAWPYGVKKVPEIT